MNYQDNFLTADEIKISQEYQDQGYAIRTIENTEALDWIRNLFINLIRKNLTLKENVADSDLFDLIHAELDITQLNDFRLALIQQMNETKGFRSRYYQTPVETIKWPRCLKSTQYKIPINIFNPLKP